MARRSRGLGFVPLEHLKEAYDKYEYAIGNFEEVDQEIADKSCESAADAFFNGEAARQALIFHARESNPDEFDEEMTHARKESQRVFKNLSQHCLVKKSTRGRRA